MPDIQIHATAEQVGYAAAELIVQAIETALAERPRGSIALSGGSTPRRLYADLGRRPWRERIEWSRLHVFVVDERFVPPEDEESNQRMIRETLLSTSPLPEENFHPMQFLPNEPERAAHEYQRELAGFFGREGLPALDLALLGMGADGHTASLFPGTRAVEIQDRWVAPTINPAGPSQRLTLTMPVINAARTVVFMVAGADKAETVRSVIQERPAAFPSAHVAPASGRLTWLLDHAAATALPASLRG
ncbi:MAG: 6-phosphogluconolactonase [Chloroflexota bacterium]